MTQKIFGLWRLEGVRSEHVGPFFALKLKAQEQPFEMTAIFFDYKFQRLAISKCDWSSVLLDHMRNGPVGMMSIPPIERPLLKKAKNRNVNFLATRRAKF